MRRVICDCSSSPPSEVFNLETSDGGEDDDVFIHGHHIFSMFTIYSQLAWNFLSSLDKWGPSVFNIYYLTRDTGTMFKLYFKSEIKISFLV